MNLTFKGGIHPPQRKKATMDEMITPLENYPQFMIYPMSQHIGAMCEAVVSPGDSVKVGQIIGRSDKELSANIYSSVSGIVKSIEPYPSATGKDILSVIIENDEKYEILDGIKPIDKKIDELDFDDIIKIIKDAGIVGMGGAGFPSHFKLVSAKKSGIDTLIINGSECEPFITSDYRRMLENSDEIVCGIKILMHAFGLKSAIIGIESNKLRAVEVMKEKCKDTGISVRVLKTKYPQGGEKQLIYALTKRIVPAGKLPGDVGCCIFNIETSIAIANAYKTGMPTIERVLCVTGGGVAQPKNLLVRLGTPIEYVIGQCGGFRKMIKKIIIGGPMMGFAQYSIKIPVTKTTSAILLLTEKKVVPERKTNCIKCGRCISVCPMKLMPQTICMNVKHGNLEELENLYINNCMECGSCAFVCPAKIPLVQLIKKGKAMLREKR